MTLPQTSPKLRPMATPHPELSARHPSPPGDRSPPPGAPTASTAGVTPPQPVPAVKAAPSGPVQGAAPVRVLVAVASRHGATAEIAERIGIAIRAALPSATVDVRAADQVATVDGYDAVVLGSAVYVGRWLEPARNLVARHGAALAAVPVWLFSSGPVGDPPKPDEDPGDEALLLTATGAREHVVLAGRLDRHQLGFAERAVAAVVRAPRGDFRDWAAIDVWAGGIAEALRGK